MIIARDADALVRVDLGGRRIIKKRATIIDPPHRSQTHLIVVVEADLKLLVGTPVVVVFNLGDVVVGLLSGRRSDGSGTTSLRASRDGTEGK